MSRKVTTESWLKDLLEKFPNNVEKFGYEKVVYHKAKEKVEIYCKTCGEYFWQMPYDHMNGKGCAKCAGNMKQTKEQFLGKLFERYPNRKTLLDFSDFEYINAQTKSKVTCLMCGDTYFVTPNDLYSGSGCKRCSYTEQAERQSSTTEEFIKKAKNVWGDRYDYSKVEYVNSQTPVVIICKEHGEFMQPPASHLQKHGCSRCAKVARYTDKTFQEQARKVHGDFYTYYPNTYRGCFAQIPIHCPIHGDFMQAPFKHLSGQGCSKCSQRGFKNDKEGCLYLLVDDLELPTCIKIGVSNDFGRRFDELTHHTPFPVHVLKVFTFEAGCATFELEQLAHTVFADRNCHFEGFDGCTEWFWYSHEIVNFLEENC